MNKPRHINDIRIDEKKKILKSKPVVLIGSGISMFLPTNLPSGGSFCKKMYDYLFFEDKFNGNEYRWLRNEIYKIPFEALMESFPSRLQLPSLICQIFSSGQPNKFHDLFAEKLKEGILGGLITTNYDMAFDNSLERLGYENRVVSNADLSRLNGDLGNVYFKIHGSTDQEESLVYTLSQESRLEDWKANLFKDLIRGKTVIILCYSGRDFDICPFLAEQNIHANVMWLNRSDNSFTAYQKYLSKTSAKNEIIIGSIQDFAKIFFDKETICEIAEDEFNPKMIFNLNNSEIYEWRLNLFNRIGCASLGLPLIETLKGVVDEVKLLKSKCEMYGHTGEYKKEANEYFKLSQCYSPSSKEHVQALIDASSAWLKSGNFIKRRRFLNMALKAWGKLSLNESELTVLLIEHQLTLMNKMYQLFPFEIVRRYIKRQVTIILRTSPLKTTNLDKVQVLEHIVLERLGLKVRKNSSMPLPSHEGYANLGLTGMAIIAYRDKMRYKNWEVGEEPLDHLDVYLETAELLGMKTELWKYCKLKMCRKELSSPLKKQVWNKWRENLRVTEYGVFRTLYEKVSLYVYYLK